MLSDISRSVEVAEWDSSKAPNLINSHNTCRTPIAYSRQVSRMITIEHSPTEVVAFPVAQKWTMRGRPKIVAWHPFYSHLSTRSKPYGSTYRMYSRERRTAAPSRSRPA